MSKPETKKSWHRLEKETARQFALFEFFLSLPPSERTSGKVGKKFGVTERYIQQIRCKNKWNARVKDRDDFFASEADKSGKKVIEQVAFDWANWERQNLDETRKIADLFRKRTLEMLEMPLTETIETETEKTKDGKTIHKTIITKPVRFTADTATRYAEAATILSKFAIEQADAERRGGAVNIHLPKPSKPLDQMNPDEIDEYLEQCRIAKTQMERGDDVQDATQGTM